MSIEPNDKKKTLTPYKATKAFTAAMIAVILAYVLISVLVAVNGSDFTESLVYFFLSYFVISFALAAGSVFIFWREKLFLSDVTNFKFHPKFIAVILLIFGGTFFGLSGINDLFVDFLQKFGYVPDLVTLPEKSILSVILCVIFIAVIPAIVEEFLFRGLILKGAESFGKLQAVFVSALAFSLYHMSPSQTVYQLVIGVLYGFIAITSGSIVPTVILHFLNNFIIIILYYFFPSFAVSGVLKIILTVIGLLCVAAGLFITVCKFDFKRDKTLYNKQEKFDYALCIVPGFIITLVMWIANLFV